MIRHPALTAVRRHPSAHGRSVGMAHTGGRVRAWWTARRRARVAAGYERIARMGERPATGLSSRIAVRRSAVRSARPELLAIAAVLRSGAHVAPSGVAAARGLVSDGTGPLYVEGDLPGALRRVLDLLGGGPRP